MSLASYDIDEIERRMRASLEAFKRELSGLRTGRASAHLLDTVQVSVYGSKMPVNQVATISVPEPRMITVQVWDRSNLQAVEKSVFFIGKLQTGYDLLRFEGTSLGCTCIEKKRDHEYHTGKIAFHKQSSDFAIKMTIRVTLRGIRIII